MLGGILLMGGIGICAGAGLALASKIFHVDVDPKIEAVEEALPGANCGGCGLPGCSANAVAIIAGKASASSCVAGGPEVATMISEIMGVKLEAREPDIAKPGCTYGVQDADLRYIYHGISDCRAAALLSGGMKVCPIGCLGLGTCVRACPFGALSMGRNNLPVVDPDLCTGCGTCERICPKHIITLTSNSRCIQREYITDDCTAPCQRACPAGIDIPTYIRQIGQGHYLEAVQTIKQTNPFPLVCGRICVHPCELECRRNLVDEPVAINHLKRFAADFEMRMSSRVQIPRAPATEHRIAIIGGGAEGLTAAYFLNRLGHDSTVYDSKAELGGQLRTAIAQNRLPKQVLDWEIQGILDAGVQAIPNRKLGLDFTVESLLKEGYSAVFVATGGWDTQLAERLDGGSGTILPGVRLLIDFIMHQKPGDLPASGKNVMILGGGKAAFTAAATCLREGASSVHLVFRIPRTQAPMSDEFLQEAEKEGIQLHFRSALIKMMGHEGSLTHAEIVRFHDDGGKEVEGTTMPVDILLTGAGRFPELIYVPKGDEGENSSWETVVPYPGPYAQEDIGMFRPGEVSNDYKAVVEAIGSGRRAANSIHRFLTGETVEAPTNMIRSFTRVLNVDQLDPVAEARRERMPERSHEERITNPDEEIAVGYAEQQALEEAKRCLQCGLICYRRVKDQLH